MAQTGHATSADPQDTAAATTTSDNSSREPVTIRSLARMAKRGEPFACLTCYDYTTAKWLDRAGVPVLLVGDTAAEMILGHPQTIHAPLDVLIALTAAVKRGAPNALVMGDMPFLSYHTSDADALTNAGRFLTEGLADAVKLEVDASFAPRIEQMARAGIPVVAHIGSKPQQAKLQGGYRSAGRTSDEAKLLLRDARAMEEAGASMLLIEATPDAVTELVVSHAGVPVIGCGAGAACHGQIVVLQDLLGLSDWQPSFATPAANLGTSIQQAAEQWRSRVSRGDLGDNPYRMRDGENVNL